MSKKRVFSLVANAGTNDARVMKQARALVEGGYDVTLYGGTVKGFPQKEVVDGIKIHRFDCYNTEGVTLEELLEVAIFVPHVMPTIKERAHSVLVGKPRIDVISGLLRTVKLEVAETAKQAKKVSTDVGSQEGSDGSTLAPTLRSWWKRWRRLARSTMAGVGAGLTSKEELQKTRLAARDAKQALNAAKRKRAVVAEIDAEFRAMYDWKNDIYFLRHALFAVNFLRLKFEFDPDFIHCHDLYPVIAGAAIAGRTGAKLIFDAHEIETERVPPLPPEKKAFIDTMERDLFVNTDHIVTCCQSSSEFYRERFIKRLPTVVMNAPEIAPAINESAELDIRQQANIPTGAPVIIYTGGVGREARGLHLVAAALSYLPDHHLVIMGPRHPKNDPWLLEEAEKHGVSPRVHLLPSVPAEQVVAAIRSANVGVCPIQDVTLSYRYAMPNKLFELTFAEIPVCVSNLPEMARFVRELGIGVVMDETDPRSIADAILEACQNPDKFHLSEEGRVLLQTKYSWSRQKESLFKTYEEVTSNV